MQNNQVVEIELSPFHKVLCIILFLTMGCGVGGGFILAPIFPQLMGAADDIANGSILTKILVSSGGCAILLLFAYPIWVASFRVRVDNQGLTVSRGTKTAFILWSEVASYDIEKTPKWHQPRGYCELVLRNANGKALFRLPERMLVSNSAPFRNGRDFWRLLQLYLNG